MSQLRLKTRWWSTTHPLVSFLEFISIFGRAACDSCFPLAYVYEIFILQHLLNIYPEKTLNSEFGFSRIYGHLMLNWYRLTLFSGIRPMILLLLNMPSHVANSTAYSWYALLDISLGSVRSARLPRVLHIVYIFRVAVSIPCSCLCLCNQRRRRMIPGWPLDPCLPSSPMCNIEFISRLQYLICSYTNCCLLCFVR